MEENQTFDKQKEELRLQTILSEYTALRAEIEARIQNQQQLFFISITFLGIVLAIYKNLLNNVVVPTILSEIADFETIIYKMATPGIRWITFFVCVIFNGLFGLSILNTKGNTAIAIYISDILSPEVNNMLQKDRHDFKLLDWRNFRKKTKSSGLSHFSYLILYLNYFSVSFFPSTAIFFLTLYGSIRFFPFLTFQVWDYFMLVFLVLETFILLLIGLKSIGDKDFVVNLKIRLIEWINQIL